MVEEARLQMNKASKIYVLDTNVLLQDSNCLNNFEDNTIVIPFVVIEELDNNKSRNDEVGKTARSIARQLDSFRKESSLSKGVSLPSGGSLYIIQNEQIEEKSTKNDNKIISYAKFLKEKYPESEIVLVSKDINVRVKCDSLGVVSEDYLSLRAQPKEDLLYTGVRVVSVPWDVIDDFYSGTPVMPATVIEDTSELSPNQILVLKSESPTHKSSISVKYYNDYTQLQRTAEFDFVYGLEPRNKEQQFALNLLMDDSIKLVSLAGASGVGKTLLSIAVGLEKIFGEEKYDRLVVTKPVQPVGKDIGFLPGSKDEKMDPWIAPIKDNLMYLLSTTNQEKTSKRARQPKKVTSGGKKKRGGHDFDEPTQEEVKPRQTKEALLQGLFENGKIEVEAITFLRGRSIPNSFIIIDEAQNLTLHELKTIITRVGENTKIVLLGDIEQIDNPTLDIYTNGLTHVIEKFKDERIAGHITLIKGERSELATIASKIL